ncbi:MAG TPA: hypothetical protein DHW82_02610 [Spirochaetia bacterium]|nr:MAG: hypothetical protein A2Y41_10480 [Spirochaetes bacterium GWB1_36_13]HCL55883.1 hypothetical protein [Spirochaetia bacterium]
MSEEKKIKIRKTFSVHSDSSNKKENPINSQKITKNLELLEQTVKKIENKYKTFGFQDSKEEEFFQNNQGKNITLEISHLAKQEGVLEGIDKFRICISQEGIKKYFFKHAVICYYSN